ncbi:chitinase 2 [Naviculisporaceae sp. PSN 640]
MAPIPQPHVPRIITYYQTHHHPDSSPLAGQHISVLPLLTQPGISLTHLILAAIHINEDPSALTLNDHAPSHARFTTLWAELRVLQASGIKVLGMLGGAAKGSFTRLDVLSSSPSPDLVAQFEEYYAPLACLIRERNLDGLDLDVEEEMTLPGIIHLIDRLKSDFGPSFIITLAPVASALISAEHNLSGFDYSALELLRGSKIDWYNCQFYCGWGDCSNPLMYEFIVNQKGWKREKVVVGLVTNPENGSGWVPWEVLGNVLPVMVGRDERFGGVMGWEYFNSLPGGRERPWEWAGVMTGLVRGRGRERGTGSTEGEDKVKGKNGNGNGNGKPGSGLGGVVEADPDDDDDDGDEPAVNSGTTKDGKKESISLAAVPVPESFEYYSDGATSDREEN